VKAWIIKSKESYYYSITLLNFLPSFLMWQVSWVDEREKSRGCEHWAHVGARDIVSNKIDIYWGWTASKWHTGRVEEHPQSSSCSTAEYHSGKGCLSNECFICVVIETFNVAYKFLRLGVVDLKPRWIYAEHLSHSEPWELNDKRTGISSIGKKYTFFNYRNLLDLHFSHFGYTFTYVWLRDVTSFTCHTST
jgi:hypothetical protein